MQISKTFLISETNMMNNKNSYPVRLSENEKSFLSDILDKTDNYLEFGSGGSTFMAIEASCKRIVSVESSFEWIEYLRTFNAISEAENKNLKFEIVDIGPTTDWGYPSNADNYSKFPDYSKNIFLKYDNNYDSVFIDGRFRVACALQTIINCSNDVKIIIHDYNNRPQYHVILEFLDIEYTIDTMALFKIKSNIDNNKLQDMYEKYCCITD